MYSQTDIQTINTILNNPQAQIILVLLMAWALAWKGFALWRAAQNSQRNWFIAMLLLNTFGILEILFLFYFSRNKKDPGLSQ
jgi:hypothetical protein